VGAFPNSLAVGDLNGDGKLDLVTANGNDASVLLGDGHGGFGAANTFIAGAGPTGVAIGDFNGDGRPDLAVTDGGSSSVSVLLGDGSGGFAAVANLATGAEPLAVAIGDFNGDGAPDLAIADFGSGNVSILHGSGLSAIQRTTIHVTAVNDPAVIAGTTTGTVVEAGGVNNAMGTPTSSGTLTDTDVDNPANSFQTVTAGTASDHYGSYAMTAAGTWTYTVDNNNAAVRALNVGQTLTDTFTVHTVDGTAQQITITIDGANVPQPPLTGNSAITPQHLFTDNTATAPTQSATPASLVVDSGRSFQLAPSTGGDGFGTGGGYGFHVVHTDAVLTTASDATVRINLALAALEAPLGGDVAMVVARQANGDPLPEWLKFDPATGSFAGLPPDNAVASIEPDQSADNNIVTGALPPSHDRGLGIGAGPNAPVAPNTITVEVLARDSKGNIAVTVFTIDLRAHTAGKQGWNLDRNEPSFGPGRHGSLPMMSPELAAIEAAVRDAAGPFEPFTLRGLPVRHSDSIAGGIREAAPTGRAGLTEQLASIGWRSMDAQRNSLLASLQQRS
jgi:VCBS repeat-containing protein